MRRVVQVVAVEPENEFSDGLPTVDGVFALIQDAINDEVDALTVSYDPELGYPTNVFIDTVQQLYSCPDALRVTIAELLDCRRGDWI